MAASDVAGAVTSAVVEEVKGARVDEDRPRLVFRAGLEETGGFVGVELSMGPGGSPRGAGRSSVLFQEACTARFFAGWHCSPGTG